MTYEEFGQHLLELQETIKKETNLDSLKSDKSYKETREPIELIIHKVLVYYNSIYFEPYNLEVRCRMQKVGPSHTLNIGIALFDQLSDKQLKGDEIKQVVMRRLTNDNEVIQLKK